MKNGYGIALNEWIFDDRIKNELRLLIYISSLTAKNGYCFASNEHFAEKFKIRTETISRQIKKLIDLNYVSAEYERAGATVKKRILTIDINVNRHCVKSQSTIDKKVKDNSTSINNTSINKVKDFFILKCKQLPKPKKITSQREKHINARIKEYDLQTVLNVIEITSKTPFLNGKNKENWKADFDWILNPNNFIKILEGKYNTKKKTNQISKIGAL